MQLLISHVSLFIYRFQTKVFLAHAFAFTPTDTAGYKTFREDFWSERLL
jgi:hypothetical protein